MGSSVSCHDLQQTSLPCFELANRGTARLSTLTQVGNLLLVQALSAKGRKVSARTAAIGPDRQFAAVQDASGLGGEADSFCSL
jgi:hypothetical protein